MKGFLSGLSNIFTAYLDLLKALPNIITKLLWFLAGLWRAIRHGFRRPPRDGCCLKLPNVHVRPDPMIYDQYYLMAQGLAVTWDNPDIQIYDMLGNPVSPYGLSPDQDYKVVARAWNNSYSAPAANMPVVLSYLSFGIGITDTFVAATAVDLGVKASAQCPAFANFTWHTPKIPGHYCLQARLIWPDDANPYNNLGQKNTQVGTLASPALFSIPVHNVATIRRRFDIELDMYQLPVLPSCSDQPPPRREQGRYAESQARWRAALAQQAYGMFPVTADWKVSISPPALELAPGQTALVDISIEPSSGTFIGTELFNVHGFASSSDGRIRILAGGVTLAVQGS